jgi:hypothetical protein
MKLEANLYRWQCTRKTRIAPSTNVQSRDTPSVTTTKLKDSTQMMQPIPTESSKEDQFNPKTDCGVGKKPDCNEIGNKTDHNVGMKTDCNVGNKSTASGTKML